MDDIIVHSKTREDHINHLHLVFKELQKGNIQIQLDKCKFMEEKIKFLGHIVRSEGIETDPEKIKAITQFPIPKTQVNDKTK